MDGQVPGDRGAAEAPQEETRLRLPTTSLPRMTRRLGRPVATYGRRLTGVNPPAIRPLKRRRAASQHRAPHNRGRAQHLQPFTPPARRLEMGSGSAPTTHLVELRGLLSSHPPRTLWQPPRESLPRAGCTQTPSPWPWRFRTSRRPELAPLPCALSPQRDAASPWACHPCGRSGPRTARDRGSRTSADR